MDEYLKIPFSVYEKHFLEALRNQNSPEFHALFYKKTAEGIEICFSWNAFKIQSFVSFDEINMMYEGIDFNTGDVRMSRIDDTPQMQKFYRDYLLDRGIPLQEE